MAHQQHHADHHAHTIADFRQRFWVILVLTIPVLLLSDTVQGLLGFKLDFPGKGYTLFGLATLIFFGLAKW